MNSSFVLLKSEGWRRASARPAAALLAVTLLASGCSSLGGSSTKSSGTTSSGMPFGDRISSLFGGGSSSQSAPPRDATPATPTAEDIDCPTMDIRQGASTLLINANGGGGDGDALGLRYQGTFVRAARECRVANGQLAIKIGVQGRIILGPAGGPGEVTVPVRMALVQESLSESTPLWSKLYLVRVNVPPGEPNANFTTISEDLVIPMPKAIDLEQMLIYIGFDPAGAEQEKRKPAPKAAAKRRTSAR